MADPTTERVSHKLDFATGRVEITQTRTTAETVEERFEGMRASLMEQVGDDVGVEMLAVRCDGCGHAERVSKPELPSGWVTNPRGEFCPKCQPAS